MAVPALPLKETTVPKLAGAGPLLFGGGVQGGEINGLKKFRRLARRLGGTASLYFATGIRPATEETMEILRRNNFPGQADPPLYYLRGGLDLEALEPSQRTLLRCYQAMLTRRRDLSPADREVLALLGVSGDYSQREALAPLVAAAQVLSDQWEEKKEACFG